MNDILSLSLVQLIAQIERKKYSIVEVRDFYLKRIKSLDKKLGSYITVVDNLQSAKGAKYPIAIKDNFSTMGIRTTAASKVLDHYVPVYESTVTKRLLDSGASILGKTNMDAWAHGASTETSDYGTTKNPYDLTRVAGGSSGGSAAAVAAGLAPAAIGSDTGGSIRGPASWCGVVGLKPTYGRVSRYGLIAMGSSWDCPGPMTTTVEDCAFLLSKIAGQDSYDQTSSDQTVDNYLSTNSKKKYRIGIPESYFQICEKETANKISEFIKKIEQQGHTVRGIKLIDPKYAISVYTILQRSEVSSNLARYDGIRYANDRSYFGSEARRRIMLGTYTLSHGYYDRFYVKAERVRAMVRQNFLEVFKKVDFIIAPSMPKTAIKLDEYKKYPFFGELADQLSEPASAAGIPVITIPVALSAHNLPIGLQIMAADFDEKRLFDIAHQIQNLANFDRLEVIKKNWQT